MEQRRAAEEEAELQAAMAQEDEKKPTITNPELLKLHLDVQRNHILKAELYVNLTRDPGSWAKFFSGDGITPSSLYDEIEKELSIIDKEQAEIDGLSYKISKGYLK